MTIEILRKLHAILRPFDNICPRHCYLCEQHETAVLFSNEEKLISSFQERLGSFNIHREGFFYLDMKTECPFLEIDSGVGECIIYNERPIDCRIFPFFPKFNLGDGSYVLLRSELYCPISANDLSQMEDAVHKVLDVVNKLASKSWKDIYNELNYMRISKVSSPTILHSFFTASGFIG